jgi:hypothetical protein
MSHRCPHIRCLFSSLKTRALARLEYFIHRSVVLNQILTTDVEEDIIELIQPVGRTTKGTFGTTSTKKSLEQDQDLRTRRTFFCFITVNPCQVACTTWLAQLDRAHDF